VDLALVKAEHNITKELYGEWHIRNGCMSDRIKDPNSESEYEFDRLAPNGALVNAPYVFMWKNTIDLNFLADVI
jgi:hypothetical protein